MMRASVLAAVCLLLAGCGRDSKTNVLIVTFDTTRADRLSCYGYAEETSPNVDALAAEGALFEQAFTTNPITLPSHTSIMTGTYPLYHGVRDNTTFVVREDVTTLAETLAEHGYDTGAVVAAFVLDSRFNLDQGFAHYNDRVSEGWSKDELDERAANAFGFAERKANLVSIAALDFLRQPRDEPFFLWLHYFDPHQPVNPPEPHHSRFAERYAGEIAYADEQLGNVIAELKKSGEYDRTIIVFTSDHGEGLMDHGEPTHSLLIFDSTMHVPLIIKAPGVKAGHRIGELASVVDIAPTVLDLLDIDGMPEAQGVSLAPLAKLEPGATGEQSIYMESYVPALQCGWGALRGLRSSTEKLIHGPKPRLFRVDTDPGEVYDLAGSDPGSVERLTGELAGRMRQWGAPEAQASMQQQDDETLKVLGDLGYITGGSSSHSAITDTLDDVVGKDDPYEMRHVFDKIGIAGENLRAGQEMHGIRQLEEALVADPDNISALNTLGKAFILMASNADRATENFRKSLEINPMQEEPHYFLSRILRGQGDYEEAKKHSQAILAFQPHSISAHMELAWIEANLGNVEAGREGFVKTLELDPEHVPALVALGTSYAKERLHDEAGPYLKKALDLAPDDPYVNYNVGIWHLQGGRVDDAIASLTRARASDPTDPNTAYILGKLLFQKHDYARAEGILRQAHSMVVQEQRRREIGSMLETIEGS